MIDSATMNSWARELGGPDYEARIDRARQLADELPFSAEVLNFYQGLLSLQKAIYVEIENRSRHLTAAGVHEPQRLELNYSALMAHLPRLLTFLQGSAPEPMAEAVRQLSSQDGSAWVTWLSDFWRNTGRSWQADEEEQDGA